MMVAGRNVRATKSSSPEESAVTMVAGARGGPDGDVGLYEMGLHFLARFTINTATVAPSIIRRRLSGSEKPRDDVRRLNEMLCHECAQAQEEYKRLRGVVDQLEREYESSKDVDMIRRYGMLKGMIKRSVMHLKVTNEEHQQVQATCGKQKEENRKREEHITGLSKEEITKENDELQEQTKEYKRKISMTKDLIEQMEHNYENSKRFIAVQRYRLMKTMIKTVIHNKWI